MNGTFRVLALTVALLGLTATADARNDSHHNKNDRHNERHDNSRHAPERHGKPDTHKGRHDQPRREPDRHEKHASSLRGSFAFGDFRFDKHDRHRKPQHDQIARFNTFWRNTGFWVQSCFKKAWWNIVWHWDRFHGKIRHKPHGGYTPPHHGKPDHHKPDWNKPDWHKPHNHHHRDKPDYHPPKPDCPPEEPPIPIPEPSSLAVLGSGLVTAWLLRRRRKAPQAD